MEIIKPKNVNQYIAHIKDGRTVNEIDEKGNQKDWKKLMFETDQGKDITSLQVRNGEKTYTSSIKGENVKQLIQLKRAQMVMGSSAPPVLVERVLGCVIADEQGNDKYAIKMTIMENTGNVVLTVEEKKPGQKWKKL